jgi:hypothetical protein
MSQSRKEISLISKEQTELLRIEEELKKALHKVNENLNQLLVIFLGLRVRATTCPYLVRTIRVLRKMFVCIFRSQYEHRTVPNELFRCKFNTNSETFTRVFFKYFLICYLFLIVISSKFNNIIFPH